MENEFQKMQRLAGVPVKEDKKQLKENFVGLPMVGNIFDRPKADYELAYEHYLGKVNEVEDANSSEVPTELIKSFIESMEHLPHLDLNSNPKTNPKGYDDLIDHAHFTTLFTDYNVSEEDLIEAAKKYKSTLNEEEGADGEENPIDAISMDVPLFIRMLEFAREDASTDMDLHDLAEKAIAMSAEGEVLSMDNYEDLVGGETEEEI